MSLGQSASLQRARSGEGRLRAPAEPHRVERAERGGDRLGSPNDSSGIALSALRESLANALIHQDLEEPAVQITVEIFDDRLEFRSPGELLIAIERFVDETRALNPELAESMRLARICEVRGSEADRALEQIEDCMQPAPRFQAETAATRVTLLRERKFEDLTQEERI